MVFGAEVLRLDAVELGSRRNPLESMMKWTPPKVASILPRNSEEIGREASARGVNSKEPQQTKFLGLEGVGEFSTNAADVTGADDMPCADSLPTDGAN